MTTKARARKQTKQLNVEWESGIPFQVPPKVFAASNPRLLKNCTILISSKKRGAVSVPSPAMAA